MDEHGRDQRQREGQSGNTGDLDRSKMRDLIGNSPHSENVILEPFRR